MAPSPCRSPRSSPSARRCRSITPGSAPRATSASASATRAPDGAGEVRDDQRSALPARLVALAGLVVGRVEAEDAATGLDLAQDPGLEAFLRGRIARDLVGEMARDHHHALTVADQHVARK